MSLTSATSIDTGRESAVQGIRFHFVDGLRGVAAMMVVIYHFTVAGTDEAHPFIKGLPGFVVATLRQGGLGVEIFFVISGFVIAYSQRGTVVTGKYFLNFAIRRSFRLDPPYWITLVLELFLLFVSARLIHEHVHVIPSKGHVLANFLYLQNVFRAGNIVLVSWTLCLEVQFYILYTLLRGIAQLAPGTSAQNHIETAVMTLLGVASLGIFLRWQMDPLTAFFYHFWFMFFLGVTVWWAISIPKRMPYFLGMTALACLSLAFRFNLPIVFAVLTGVAIFTAAKLNRMQSWLSGRIIQFLGRISYSLYLLHVVIGTRVILFVGRFTGASAGARLCTVSLGVMVSIGAATVMYLLVERPSMRLSKRLLGSDRKKRTEPAHLTTVE